MFRKRSVKGDPLVEFQCTIRFLDDSEPLPLTFKKDTLGHTLFDQVCTKLNLVEKDYFGLRYVDSEKQRHWLDPLKTVYKQLKGVNPLVLCFRVKFYPADPMKLHEEITRYYMFLQLRRDLHHGRLLCSPADANLLAAYIIQSEVGDYHPEDHPAGYVTEFKMLPKQNSKMEDQIMELHKTLSGQVPAEAESNFLKKASTLDTYGVDPHQVKDQKGTQLYLGVTHQGIMTFHGSRRTQLYKWNQIRRIAYEGKMFIVHVNVADDEEQANSKKKQQPIGYKCLTVAACKYLWKCAVEQQLFFTLSSSAHPPKLRSGGTLFSRGSKFRFSGRCQSEAYNASEGINRTEPPFNRSSSLPNYTRKSDSKTSLKLSTSLITDPVKEDKKDKKHNESPIDVKGLENKAEVIPPSPVVKAPIALPELVVESVESKEVNMLKSEPPPKLNGSIPTGVMETTFDVTPPYEPNQTIEDSSEDEIIEAKPSLEDQLKNLEEEIIRKESFRETNHVDAEKTSPVVNEVVMPCKVNNVESTPNTNTNSKIQGETTPSVVQEPPTPKSKGASCCRIILFTFMFVFLTLTVVMVVVYNSNIDHPFVNEFRDHLKFVTPVRDYITDKVQGIFKS